MTGPTVVADTHVSDATQSHLKQSIPRRKESHARTGFTHSPS
jgi:hypothetical protein